MAARPSLTRLPVEVPLERLLGVTVTSALLLAICELALIREAIQTRSGTSGLLKLAPLLAGTWAPYTALGAAWLLGSEGAARRLASGSRSLAWLGLLGACLIAPYGGWLAHYTFSGPNVGSLASRWLWIGALAVLISGCFGAVTVWTGQRASWRRAAPLLAACWFVLAGSALLASKLYLPNEYEPLHAALGYFAVLGSVLGCGELLPRTQRLGRRTLIGGWGALAGCTLITGAVLTRSNDLAWLVWGETPGARYVTHRFTWTREGSDDLLPTTPSTAHAGSRRSERARRNAPHIIVFSIDNVQPDHVGAYGYRARPTTPNIDRLASRGTLFRRAYSYQPQTRVFMTSMLLGRRIPDFGAHQPPASLQETSLPRLLKSRDYYTLVKGVFELTKYRKFRPQDYLIDTNIERETPEQIRAAKSMPHIPYEERFRIVDEHLRGAAGRPVFVWLHLLGPHWIAGRFDPSSEFPFGKDLDALYDSAIAGTDVWLGRLQRMVQERLGDDRDVYWIVMSDHGAGLTPGATKGEKGKSILERHVHVPLVVAGPGIQVGAVDVPVDSALDMAVTVLELAGIEAPTAYDGISLLPTLERGEIAPELAERIIPLRNAAWTGAVHKQWKYVNYRNVDQLFDLAKDATETRNLADEEPDLVRRLRASSRKQLRSANRLYKDLSGASN